MAERWTDDDIPSLDGRVAVVTGSNAGLGQAAASMLARRGATVVLACRNRTKAEAAAAELRAAGATRDIELVDLDLADLASVRRAADEVADRHSRLDLLVNNAGLMAVDEGRTVDGFEIQIGVNHLGHFALTAHLAPVLRATPGSRIVNVSSMGHRAGKLVLDDLMFERRRYARWPAYFQSKLANLLFTAELHRRLTESGAETAALAAHPGASHTDLGTEGSGLLNRAVKIAGPLGQSAHAGALPIVRAATDPAARGGQYYGPNLLVRGHPVLETPSRRARNAADARALWAESEALTGVTVALA
jgi:NAD(P)-dependent dehydrogenase (short-subunit alcohol dehydrogenase family)